MDHNIANNVGLVDDHTSSKILHLQPSREAIIRPARIEDIRRIFSHRYGLYPIPYTIPRNWILRANLSRIRIHMCVTLVHALLLAH